MTQRWRGPWLFALLFVVAIVLRAQTYGNPAVEFDEQFYLLVGDRMLHGALPYIDIWDRKPVGLFLIFATIRLLGGDGVLAYQLVATLVAAATAFLIAVMTGRRGGRFGGPAAGIAYLLWLDLLQGEGGQAAIFYNLPVAAAALATVTALDRSAAPRRIFALGCTAMLLVGLAIQIKYTVALEGALFGCWLLWAARRKMPIAALGLCAAPWVALAALPTLGAWVCYAALGHMDAFVFANFTSVMLRGHPPLADLLGDVAVGAALCAIPASFAVLGWRMRARDSIDVRFTASWLGVALLALFALRSFSPHYFLPLIMPLLVLAAPAIDHYRRTTLVLALIVAAAGQALLGFYAWNKGDRATTQAMVRAIGPVPHCLYVHDGFPALYYLTHSCLPTRFAFPGLLNTAVESGAIGVDPVVEVRRIFAAAPDAVVTDRPLFAQRNRATQAVVEAEIAAHYRLVLALKTGADRTRLVYRRISGLPASPVR